MKIEKIKISYSTTIPIMSYGVNDKIGVEIEVDAESNPFDLEHLVTEHKANVDAIVRKLYPNMYQQEKPLPDWMKEPETSQSQPYENLAANQYTLEEVIPQCKTLQELSMYEKIIDKKPEGEEKRKLWLIYDEIFQKLSNQNTTTE